MIRSLIIALAGLASLAASAQISFTNMSNLFNDATVRSGVALGVADMNGDGLDDLIRLHDASDLSIEYQQPGGGQFTRYLHGNAGPQKEWGMAIADIDEDGYNDVIVGGVYNRLKVFLMDASGVDSVYWMPLPDIFMQAANFADIDNDGLIDLFACNDDGIASAYRSLGGNDWDYDLSLINTASPTPSDNSGNYGSVWTDYDWDGDIDLYISKCRGGVSNPFDGRRTNLLFENDGAGNYTEVAVSVGLRPLAQSWSTDFGDIDNDGDLDAFIVMHDTISKLYENVDGQYVNITSSSGMYSTLDGWSNGIQAVFDDLDNDTWLDLIVTGIFGHHVFRNNGDGTFAVVAAFPAGTPGVHSIATGDLNNDGFIDVYAGFASGFNTPSSRPDRLLMNDGNGNNWIKVRLKGMASNINGIGARLELYGSWGKQIREIRGGEGYGIVTSLDAHFGLGADSVVDSLVVLWPTGIRDVLWNPGHNQSHIVQEGCYPTGNGIVSGIEAVICEGDEYVFFGSALTDEGTYSHLLTSSAGCDSAVILELSVSDIDESVTQDGYTLTAAPGLSYQWIHCSNGLDPVPGANGQSFTPEADGNYAVIVSDETCSDTSACFNIVGTAVLQDIFPFLVDVFPNPSHSVLNIRFGQLVEDAGITVRTVHGTTVFKEAYTGLQDLQIDVSAYPPGNYILEIRSGGAKGYTPFIRQ